MIEALITIIFVGFSAGFIFSIPVAGPINVIVTSNALSGKLRYCIRTALGASIIEFIYIVIIVIGISSLYSFYRPFIPYLLIAGAIVLIAVGIKIIKTKFSLENKNEKTIVKDKLKNKGGMRTGILINLTNPSLFLGWLTSTFLIFSFVSSIGLNTGGLNLIIKENVNSIRQMTGSELKRLKNLPVDSLKTINEDVPDEETLNPLLLGSVYGFSVAFGSFIWLYIYSKTIVKFRKKLNLKLVNRIIQMLGVILLFVAVYLIYKAVQILLI
jgi:threonine/homoserine/homoserine lactone efflux protein